MSDGNKEEEDQYKPHKGSEKRIICKKGKKAKSR